MHTRQVLETGDDVALDRGVVRRAVLAISIWVAVDGALFLLAGGRDLRRVIRHAALAIVAGIRRRRHQSLVARQIRTASTLATRQRDWERADEQARLLAESFRQRRLLDLEQASRQAGANRTSLDLVNAVLASAVWSPRARADH
jgi:hypothetical protein